MVTARHVGMGWILAGLAMAGLAGGVALAQGAGGADSGPAAVRAATAGPQTRRAGPRRWHRPALALRSRRGGAQRLDRPLLLALRRLDLTDQQWNRVQAILEVQQLRRGAAGTQQERRAQTEALLNPGDPNHGQAVQAIKDRAVARIDQAAHTQQALYEVLTPAQKTQLQQLITQRRDRLRQRLQQRGARRGGAGAQQSAQPGASAPGQ